MAVLLAWPWQIVLSTAETSLESPVTVAHPRLDEPARHLHTAGPCSKWSQGDRPDFALVLVIGDAQEEDESGPQAFLLTLAPAHSHLAATRAVDRPAVLTNRIPSRPIEHRLQLRC